MKRILACAGAAVVALSMVFNSAAQPAGSGWPMFRGNAQRTGQGVVAGPVVPELLWSYSTGDGLDSSAAVGPDGKTYIGSWDNTYYVLTSAGSLGWSYITGSYIWWSSPALVVDGRSYVGSVDDTFYAFTSGGTIAWSYVTGDVIYSSPALGPDNTLYIGSDDYNLYALTSNGSLSWTFATGGYIYSSPALDPNGRVYVGSQDNVLYAILSGGTLGWSYATGDDVQSVPAVGSDGRIYAPSDDKNLYAFNSNGTVAWSYAFDAGFYPSSPTIGTDARVVVGSDDTSLRAFSSGGSLLWSYITGDKVGSSPTRGSDGRICVGSDDNNLYVFNSGGSLLWSYAAGNSFNSSSPALGPDGRIYVGNVDNNLYVFKGPPPNYINLSVAPAPIIPGGTATFAYRCDFGTWNYQGVPVDIYLAAVRAPLISDAPSTVGDALGGGTVYLFGRNMVPYLYTGTVREPTFRNLSFPPIPTSASVSIPVPALPGLAGNYLFATAFIRRDTGAFVRADGLPVENSNGFLIQ